MEIQPLAAGDQKAQSSAYQTPEANFEEMMGSVEVPRGHRQDRNGAVNYQNADEMIKQSMESLDEDHSEMDCQSSYSGAESEQLGSQDEESDSSSASTLAPLPVRAQADIILKPNGWRGSA